MYHIFARNANYIESHFGAKKTAAEAKELCNDIRRTRPEYCDIWYERSNGPEEQYLAYRGSCYNRRYYQ